MRPRARVRGGEARSVRQPAWVRGSRAALAPTLLALALAAPAAHAGWSAASLVSASASEQAQAGVVPAEVDVSADGRRVVFRTSSRNLFDDPEPPGAFRQGGIFRKDLLTGALTLVAPGNVVDASDPTQLQVGAQDPSISGDGRYVAFDTSQGLVPQDVNGVRDVYVRDMTQPASAPSAYALVSAPSGSETPIAYDPAASGSFVGARGAISDDGRRVAFVVADASSDGGAGGTEAPGGQLLLRDLDTRSTTLVTVGLDGRPAGGAGPRAVLSGDGTTVAWPGANVSAQAPVVAGEQAADDPATVEYLWRRVADGAAAVTRRVSGTGDPDDPGCPPGGSVSSGDGPVVSPCDGPFQAGTASIGQAGLLALSRDGREVAFAALPRLRGLPLGEGGGAELFLADMRSGRSRKQALTELTRGSVNATDVARSAGIVGVGLSGDGRYLAFGTARIGFLLPQPALIGPVANVPGAQQVYVADLVQRTLQLVTFSFDGAQVDVNGANASPALDDTGDVVAFASEADRLVLGDGNSAVDAFVVRRLGEVGAPLPQQLPPTPAPLRFAPQPTLRARAITRAHGRIVVRLIAPGGGRVQVRAALGRRTLVRAGRGFPATGTLRLTLRVGSRAQRRARRSSRPLKLRALLAPTAAGSLARVVTVRREAW
jgi:hypothetical protein